MKKTSLRCVVLAGVSLGLMALASPALAQSTFAFNPADLVISVYGDGAAGDSATYLDNQATPITLQQLSLTGVSSTGVISSTASAQAAGQLVLPQSGANPISGEFGSSSEGILQRSVNGSYLTIAGYDVNATQFNANPSSYGGTTKSCINQGTCFPLAQTPSSSVEREIALVGNGYVNTSTTLGTTAFSGNNPRSVVTVDGSSFYVSGQGAGKNTPEADQGVFFAQLGAHSSTPIDNSFETRDVSIYNGNLYVSADSTEGSGVHENISSYTGLPTSASSATILNGIKSKFTVTSASQLNGLDVTTAAGAKIYLSPEQYFFANSTTLYVADSGNPKGDNNGSGGATQGLSDGGLQKWTLNTATNTWTLDYTISAGLLNFVPDTTACGANSTNCGTTGLIGLTGEVVGGNVELFATNSTLGDLDQTYLYGITDSLNATTEANGEAFTELYQAAPDTIIRGVALAPLPEPSSWALMILGIGGIGWMSRRARASARAQGVAAV
jgi:hypothetical protein